MAAPDTVVNVAEKLESFEELFAPRIVAEFNGYQLKVVRAKGDLDWHHHDETDELFLVVAGTLRIELADRAPVLLGEGELFVVPRGLEHRPVATEECHVLLVEPAGTPNTGDVATAATEEWV
ncbi:MAG: cupin domain-containing protein [Actinobacteria bacterium]|nr:cupin domain-containing protein [Actinomycetota bacterium]